MIKKTSPAKKQPSAKEKILAETTQLLSSSLGALKDVLGEKKFEKRIKKAAKILVQGFKDPAVKQAVAEKASVKKASVGRPRKTVAATPEAEIKAVAKKKGSVGRPRKIVTEIPKKEAKPVSKKKAATASKAAKKAPKK